MKKLLFLSFLLAPPNLIAAAQTVTAKKPATDSPLRLAGLRCAGMIKEELKGAAHRPATPPQRTLRPKFLALREQKAAAGATVSK